MVDRLSGGLSDTGEHLTPVDGERIVRLVAHHVGSEVHPLSRACWQNCPQWESGSRVYCCGCGAHLCDSASRRLRYSHSTTTWFAGTVGAEQAAVLRITVARRRNIFVAGETSTGKTALINALLAEVKLAFTAAFSRADQVLIEQVLTGRSRKLCTQLAEGPRRRLGYRFDRAPQERSSYLVSRLCPTRIPSIAGNWVVLVITMIFIKNWNSTET